MPGAAPVPGPTRALVPRDAATLVLVDGTGGAPRILMGRRRRDLAFLPGKYVFPGGRVDRADRQRPIGDGDEPGLCGEVLARLLGGMRGRPSARRAHALAHAALRETREETGLVVGGADGAAALPHLAYLARAVTPPGNVRRYDTRFFLADAVLITDGALSGDGELSGLDWFTLEAVRALDLPGITRLVVEDIADALDAGRPSALARSTPAVPFYHSRHGRFHRTLE